MAQYHAEALPRARTTHGLTSARGKALVLIVAVVVLAVGTVVASAYQHAGAAAPEHASVTRGSSKGPVHCVGAKHGHAVGAQGAAPLQPHAGGSCKAPAHCVTAKRVHATGGSGRTPTKHRPAKKCKTVHAPLKKPPVFASSPATASAPAPAPPVSIVPTAPAPPTGPLLPEGPGSPLNVMPPTIAGTAAQGQVLGASSGSWTEAPTSYAYRWQDCNALGEACTDATGATASSYTLAVGDVGHTMRVVVTASNASGSTAARSLPSAVVSAKEGASAPLVGSSTLEPSPDTDSAGSAEAFQYVASASGLVRSISLYVDAANTAPAIVVGLYTNISERPGTLLASATISPAEVGAWNTAAVSPVVVSSGTVYWLAALAPSGRLALRDIASNGGATQNSASRSLSALPSAWASGRSWANFARLVLRLRRRTNTNTSFGADKPGAPVGDRACRGRGSSDGVQGHLDRGPHVLCLPVAGLQLLRHELLEHQRLDVGDAQAGLHRCRTYGAGARDRRQRSRQRLAALGGHSRRREGRRSQLHEDAERERNGRRA